MRSRPSPQPTRSCPSTTAGADRGWRRNSESLENSGKDLSRSLASLRSVKRIACVEPLAMQRHSARTNLLQTFKKRCLADRSAQPPPPFGQACPLPLALAAQGISLSSVLAAYSERSRRSRCRTADKPRETANRALRSDPGGGSFSGEPGWKQETGQPSDGNGQNEPGCRPSSAIAV